MEDGKTVQTAADKRMPGKNNMNYRPDMYPVIMDMKLTFPMPVYYMYCTQHKVISTINSNSSEIAARFPWIINGGKGTARSTVAYFLYQKLNQQKKIPGYRIECLQLTEEKLDKLFCDPGSAIYSGDCFLFFHEAGRLSKELQNKVVKYLMRKSYYVVLSTRTDMSQNNAADVYSETFIRYFSPMANVIQMQSLGGHINDLYVLSYMLLNYYNSEYSTQIVGFDKQAVNTIQKYSWPGNITQLNRVISAAVIQTKEIYITEKTIVDCITRNSNNNEYMTVHLVIDKNSTLIKAEKEIVQAVLRQENWNQTKTAARLGISRSTLWRLLKK